MGIICEYLLQPTCTKCEEDTSSNHLIKLFVLLNFWFIAYFIFSSLWRLIRSQCVFQKNLCSPICFEESKHTECHLQEPSALPRTSLCSVCCNREKCNCMDSCVETIRIKVNENSPVKRWVLPLNVRACPMKQPLGERCIP